MPTITVVGSFVFDLVFRAPHFPRRGETLLGHSFGMFAGGKGFNQAIAAARQGATVGMVGRLGADDFGDRMLAALDAEGIDRRRVVRDPLNGTAVACPIVTDDGGNAIINIPRANLALTPADVEAAEELIARADVLLLQLEVTMEASRRAAEIARRSGVKVVLNPAPARPLPDDFLRLADLVVPNEVEAAMLTGEADPSAAALALHGRGVSTVVVTLGERGALISESGRDGRASTSLAPAFPVTPVDTTAAGDAFCGTLAVALADGQPLAEAVRVANAAGALATTVLGAEPSLPRREAVESLLARA